MYCHRPGNFQVIKTFTIILQFKITTYYIILITGLARSFVVYMFVIINQIL
jgi:hypothetical protein